MQSLSCEQSLSCIRLLSQDAIKSFQHADTKGKDWEILSHATKQTVVPLQYQSDSKDLCLSVPNVPKIVPWSPVFGQNMTRNRWALPHVCLSGIMPSRDHLPGLPLSLHVCILKPSGTWAEEPIHTEVCVPSHTPRTHPRGEDLRILLVACIFRKKQHIAICSCNTTSRLGLCERSGEVMCTKCYHAQELLNA